MTDVPKDPIGVAMYEKVLGVPEPADRPLTGIREPSINHLFAKIWTRAGLSIRERRLITIALLTAQGRHDQLKSHLRGARLGEDKLTEEEILEIMIHTAHYAGWAAGASGQSTALDVLKEIDREDE
jgi:4-carboxymuconolactone decarboxylase